MIAAGEVSQGLADEIAAAFVASCRDEIDAPKPGNVHHFAGGHGMEAEEFLVSASAAAHAVAESGAPVGRRILAAVSATFAAVGKNTNLGILLLCVPLAAAAELRHDGLRHDGLQANLAHVLRRLDRSDAEDVFAAIRLARPAGLGEAPRHDVRGVAQAGLREIMQEAAARDRIALQYATVFDDIFVTGLAELARARAAGLAPPWTTVSVYLAFLAAFPDTHLVRKCGSAAAAEVQDRGRRMRARFAQGGADCLAELLALDGELKALGRNPGTSADLTVATLFADRLGNILLHHRNDG